MIGSDALALAARGFAAAAVIAAFGAARAADDAGLRPELERVSRLRVFFGHQSVGVNLLDGLRDLAAREGVALRIAEVPSASGIPPGTFAHGFMPENGNPGLKLESFERAFRTDGAEEADVAFLKFCYVDFDQKSDVRAIFDRYQATLRALQSAHPRTRFVHVTVPLTTVQGGWKALLKRLLGRPPYGFLENARREELNELLRKAYAGREPLFDLARIESIAPDGAAQTYHWKGRAVPTLYPGYTDDGGHLSRQGRTRAARALVAVLADAGGAVTAAPAAGRPR